MIKSIRLQKMQAIDDFTYEFPETGVVGIVGPNNSGKSILQKALCLLIKEGYKYPKERNTLIQDHCETAQLTITKYDGSELFFNVGREAKDTYITVNGVTRYMRDKNIHELVEDFGFHYNKEEDFSLHIHEDNSPHFLVDTPGTFNKAAVEEALGDKVANRALTSFEELTSDFKNVGKALAEEIRVAEAGIAAIQIYDTEGYQEAMKDFDRYDIELSYLRISLQIPHTVPAPLYIDDILYLDTKGIERVLEPIKADYSTLLNDALVFNNLPRLSDAKAEIRDLNMYLKALEENKCPTCGRSWDIDDCI